MPLAAPYAGRIGPSPFAGAPAYDCGGCRTLPFTWRRNRSSSMNPRRDENLRNGGLAFVCRAQIAPYLMKEELFRVAGARRRVTCGPPTDTEPIGRDMDLP